MVQTPTQRRANLKFANREAAKMGAYRPPKEDRETRKKMELNRRFGGQSLSRWIVYLLVFVICGGIFVELIRLFF